MYKEVYKNLSESFKSLQGNIKSYEKTIEDLQYEVGTMVKELREKDKLIAMQITKEGKNLDMSKDLTDNARTSKSKSNSPNKKDKDNNILRNLNFCITNDVYNYKLDTSEWRDVIRIVGFNEEDYNQMFDVHKNKKAIDCIDVLLSIVLEKNVQIEVLNLENKKLNTENQVLYDETTIFKKQVSTLEEKIEAYKLIEEKYEKLKYSQLNSLITPKIAEKNNLIHDDNEREVQNWNKNKDLNNQTKTNKPKIEYREYNGEVLNTNENQILYQPTTVSKSKKTKAKFNQNLRKSSLDNASSNSINSSDLIDSNNENAKNIKIVKKRSGSSDSSCHNTYVKLTSKHNYTVYNSNNSSSNNNLESAYLFRNKRETQEKNSKILASKIYNSQKISNKNINKNNTNIYNITVSTLANNHIPDSNINIANKNNELEYINLNTVGNIKNIKNNKSNSTFKECRLNTENDIYKKVLNKLNRLTLNNESLQSMSNQSTEKNKNCKNVIFETKTNDKNELKINSLNANLKDKDKDIIKDKEKSIDKSHLRSILQKKNLQLALGTSDDKTESSANLKVSNNASSKNIITTQINMNQINEELFENTLPKESDHYKLASDCLLSLKAPRESPGQVFLNSTSNKSYKKGSSRIEDTIKSYKRPYSKASNNSNTSNNNTPSKNGNMKHRLLERLKSLESHLTNNVNQSNKPVSICIKENSSQNADGNINPEYLITEQNISIEKKYSNNDSYLISIKPDYQIPNDRKNTNSNSQKNKKEESNYHSNKLMTSDEKPNVNYATSNSNSNFRYSTLQSQNKKLSIFTQNNKFSAGKSPSNSSSNHNNNPALLNGITNKIINSIYNNLVKIKPKSKVESDLLTNEKQKIKIDSKIDNKIDMKSKVGNLINTNNYNKVSTKSSTNYNNKINNDNNNTDKEKEKSKNINNLSSNFNNKTTKASNYRKKLSNMEDILSNSINDNDSIVLITNNMKEFTFDSCTSAEFKKEIEKNNEEMEFENNEKDDDVMEKLDQMSIRIQTANY